MESFFSHHVDADSFAASGLEQVPRGRRGSNDQDPIGFGAGDPNLYRYVTNDTPNATDPSGLWWWPGKYWYEYRAAKARSEALDEAISAKRNAMLEKNEAYLVNMREKSQGESRYWDLRQQYMDPGYRNRAPHYVAHMQDLANTGIYHNAGAAFNVSAAMITFGHGARHLQGTGLSSYMVEAAIRRELAAGVPAGGRGWVQVQGQWIQYRPYVLPNGTVNVGTYFPVAGYGSNARP